MNKIISQSLLIIVMLLFFQNNFAQVGVGTTNPLQNLHIAGTNSTIRIEGLNSTNNVLNNGIDLAPVAVNANGDLVLGGSPFLSTIIVDQDYTGFLGSGIDVVTINGQTQIQTVHTNNIILTQQALVEISYVVPCLITDGSGASVIASSAISDGLNRVYGIDVYINGSREGGQSAGYTNSAAPSGWSGGGYISHNIGYFTISGSVFKILPAGNHTIHIDAFALGVFNNVGGSIVNFANTGVRYGGNFSRARFKVIKHN